MRGRIIDLTRTFNGRQRLTIELDGDFRQTFDELHDQEVEITVKKWLPNRSLDANGYMWVLVDKLAKKLRLPKTAVYRDHIREVGGVSVALCIKEDALDRFRQDWERRGLGWQTDVIPSKIPGCKTVIAYYGSSTYDTGQMSALIDSLVQDCKALRIETLQPEKIKSLLEEKK